MREDVNPMRCLHETANIYVIEERLIGYTLTRGDLKKMPNDLIAPEATGGMIFACQACDTEGTYPNWTQAPDSLLPRFKEVDRAYKLLKSEEEDGEE